MSIDPPVAAYAASTPMTAGCERENAAGRRQVEKVAQHDQARQTAAVVATLRHRRAGTRRRRSR
jgi:hypothetical protein